MGQKKCKEAFQTAAVGQGDVMQPQVPAPSREPLLLGLILGLEARGVVEQDMKAVVSSRVTIASSSGGLQLTRGSQR